MSLRSLIDLSTGGPGQVIPVGDPRIQTDAQGRQFLIGPDGQPVYSRPIGFDAQGRYTYDPSKVVSFNDTGGMFHSPSSWNFRTGQYDQGGIDWGKLIPILGAAGMGVAGGAAALGGGAADAATAGSVAGDVATDVGPGIDTGTVAGASAGDVVGGLSDGGAAGAGTAAASGWTAERIAKLADSLGIPAATLIANLNRSGASGGGGGNLPGPLGPQISQTLSLMNQRLQSEQPVHDAAMQLALKMGTPSNPDPALLARAANTVTQPVPTTMTPSPALTNAIAAMARRYGG